MVALLFEAGWAAVAIKISPIPSSPRIYGHVSVGPRVNFRCPQTVIGEQDMKMPLCVGLAALLLGLTSFSPIVYSLDVKPFCATPKIIDEYLSSKGYIFKPEFSGCNTRSELEQRTFEPRICTLTYFPTPSAIADSSSPHSATLSTTGIRIALVTEYPAQTRSGNQKSCLEKNGHFMSPDQIRSNAAYFQRLQGMLKLKSQN